MKILIFSPHADDAEIGMAGTIAKFVDEGHEVKIVCLIIPCEDITGTSDSERKEIRLNEAIESSNLLGVELEILDMDPYSFSFNRKYIHILDKIIIDYNPEKVFSCWEHDSHHDHKMLANIVSSITRKNNASVYMYETMLPGGISSHGFNPQMYVDISKYSELKSKTIKTYKSVFGDSDYVEAIMGRARFRGKQIGVEYSEAFEIIKEIIY